MRAPPNLGFGYARRFRAVYPGLAEKNDLPLVPFLLEGVAGVGSLNQADMIHPTAEGPASGWRRRLEGAGAGPQARRVGAIASSTSASAATARSISSAVL